MRMDVEKLLLIIAAVVMVVLAAIALHLSFRGSPITCVPYTIFVKKITPEMRAHCAMDPNCMRIGISGT